MSGGSLDYACWKLERIADDLSSENYDPEYDSETIKAKSDHPLRVLIVEELRALAHVLHEIEWSDSGDTGPDDWVVATKAYLRDRNRL